MKKNRFRLLTRSAFPVAIGIMNLQTAAAAEAEPTEHLLYGVTAWVVIGIVLLLAVIVLLVRRHTGNGMTGAQVYAYRRDKKRHPSRLLDDEYYIQMRRKK